MSNFSRATLARVGRFLGGEEHARPIAKLSEWSGVSPKSIRNWMLSPDDPQYRQMPPLAKRMLALLAYFSMTGQLTKQRLADIQALEKVMEDEKVFQITGRRISHVLAKANEFSAEAPLSEEEIASDEITAEELGADRDEQKNRD
jgi:hypothetical protein